VWSKRLTEGRAFAIALVAVLVVAVALGAYFAVTRDGGRTATQGEQVWTCPMHPSVIRSEPGSCPICGMDLVPVEEEEKEGGGIEGHGVVEIDPEKRQLIGVVTTVVERRPLERAVRTVGRVTVDETRLSHIHAKVEGWIETLYAEETGKLVRRGEPLLTIYSPELVSTQEEYLLAVRSRDRLADSRFPEVRRSGESLLEAARQRLRLWDISEEQIGRLEETGEVQKALTLYAPSTGYVMEKGNAIEGMRVTPGMTLYTLADLSRVWVEADIYESEAPLVEVGQAARLTLPGRGGEGCPGQVSYVYPTVEAKTRTVKARLECGNPELRLKPDMYVDVEIAVPRAEVLAIPQEAVLDSGVRKVVFVEEEEGRFAPREVTVGPRAGGYYPVLTGLQEGELVVSSPNFLIDSESRFQAAIEAMKHRGKAQ
jgi:Cu(I)/Ag(I) efflux system membrane fusion protein/cobalt-zinc-cadmium efflux system membrane fusion protein